MQLNNKLYGPLTPFLLSIQLNFKPYVGLRLWNILNKIFQSRNLTYVWIQIWSDLHLFVGSRSAISWDRILIPDPDPRLKIYIQMPFLE
jgi:hypothetical protein